MIPNSYCNITSTFDLVKRPLNVYPMSWTACLSNDRLSLVNFFFLLPWEIFPDQFYFHFLAILYWNQSLFEDVFWISFFNKNYHPIYFLKVSYLISEWLFGGFNFQKKKTQKRIWWVSALDSKKWSNQKDKGAFIMINSLLLIM